MHGKSVKNRVDPWDFHHSSPIVAGNVVYIGTEGGLVYGLDTSSGKQVFKCRTAQKDIIRTTPVISGNLIFFGDWNGVMFAYNITDGKKVWEYDTKSVITYPHWKNAIQTTPVIHNDAIIFGGRSSRLFSLNLKTGKKNWIYKSPTDQWLVGGLKISNGIIYFGSSDQFLFHAMDAEKGTLVWQVKLDCRVWGTAFVDGKNVYIGSDSLFIIDKNSGKINKRFTFPKFRKNVKFDKYVNKHANIHSSPVLYNNKIIFGSDDGHIYALKAGK